MSPQDKASNRPAGKGGNAGKAAAAGPPRMSREAALALVLLPVLLVAGFLIGGQLLTRDDAPTAAAPTVEPTAAPTAEPDEPAEDPAAGPDPEVAGPTVPSPAVTDEPAPSPEPSVAPEPTQAPAPTPEPEPAPGPEPAPAPGAAPATTSVSTVVVLGPGSVDQDVRTFQQQMVDRGWAITVDGIYGPQTASVTRVFQAEKGLVADGLIGLQTWNAAWEAPVT